MPTKHVRDLSIGDVVSYQGVPTRISSIAVLNGKDGGEVSYIGGRDFRTAVAWLVTLENGVERPMHPNEQVSVLDPGSMPVKH